MPSGPPQNINCQSRSPNSLLLEWSKPKREERNGIIRGYWLEYYPRTLWYGKSYHEPILSSDALFVHFPMIGDDFSHHRSNNTHVILFRIMFFRYQPASEQPLLWLGLHSGQNYIFGSIILFYVKEKISSNWSVLTIFFLFWKISSNQCVLPKSSKLGFLQLLKKYRQIKVFCWNL